MPHYGKDGSARGRDPLGNHERKKLRSSSPRYGKAYRESLGLEKLKSKVDKKIINEAEDVDTEYKNEVSSSLRIIGDNMTDLQVLAYKKDEKYILESSLNKNSFNSLTFDEYEKVFIDLEDLF